MIHIRTIHIFGSFVTFNKNLIGALATLHNLPIFKLIDIKYDSVNNESFSALIVFQYDKRDCDEICCTKTM